MYTVAETLFIQSVPYFVGRFFMHERFCTMVKFLQNEWAIPDSRCTPPKKDMEIPKILPTFFIGNSKKINHFVDCKGTEDMGIPETFKFCTKTGNNLFFVYCV